MERKVLIITYYWPPSGGSGVQRWLKFVKYLPGFGWEPYVFTPENPSFAIQDNSLVSDVPKEAEIIRIPIWEPYNAFMKFSALVGRNKSIKPTELVSGEQKSLFQKVSGWIRGNFFIPDPRVFWVKPSVRFLHDFLRENKINTIVTTGPPHSMHLIGFKLKKKNPSIKWVADFRDPWSEWGLLDSLMVGKIAHNIHRKLEAKVLRYADVVTTITPFYVRRFEELSGRTVSLLTNGYDHEDFESFTIHRKNKFVIRHVGTVNEKCNPRPFMLAVQQLAAGNADFSSFVQVDFVGDVHPQFKAYVVSTPGISKFTTFTAPVPHNELLTMYGQSSLLLIILTGYKDAAGYMPGKLFEYLATGLPVLGTGPEQGDTANLLKEHGIGRIIDEHKTDEIKRQLLEVFLDWMAEKPFNSRKSATGYSRKELTRQLTELL
ncbi:MAG: glycosyl transferase [Cyclobacteriaceae bacterium]|nr:glycosyl transferase [Cyclobacteriaceae bacterium]MDH4296344.1 glycosyl transferase [Cyclobacteriaceae bacterium]MDH5248704.1 glycosyl transferase [Cyclobacteriaceae bacterium]